MTAGVAVQEQNEIAWGSRRALAKLSPKSRRELKIVVEPSGEVMVFAPSGETLDAVRARVDRKGPWIFRQIGDIAHKGVVYPGEQEPLVSRQLWQEVNDKHKLSRSQIRRHRRVESPLKGFVRCGHCGALLAASFTSRQGERHLYYVCRAGKKQQPVCPQQPVRAEDLEQSLRERLERRGIAVGFDFEPLLRAVSYHSDTRRVSAELEDAMRLDFPLPVPIRPGVRRTGEEAPLRGRTPRISRLMALAIRFDGLLLQGAVRNRRELAEAGHVSRTRLSQILQLNHLAPEIQEQLLFLPPIRRGPDPLLERHLRADKAAGGAGTPIPITSRTMVIG